jgi:hypothetical protein
LLYPVRFLYSWESGKVASNDDAVAYVTGRKLVGFEADLLARALRCKNAEEDIWRLFLERRRLRDLLRICAGHVRTAEGA